MSANAPPTRAHSEMCSISRAAAVISNFGTFSGWLRGGIRDVIPHQMALIVLAHRYSFGVVIEKAVRIDLPRAYLAGAAGAGALVDKVLLSEWFEHKKVRYFPSELGESHALDPRWVRNLDSHGLRNVIHHGHEDAPAGHAMWFAFYSNCQPFKPEHGGFMEELAPSLHTAARRAIQDERNTQADRASLLSRLSAAERGIAMWVKYGKTNWEIANILGKSELTIKTHLQKIFVKLNVRNRCELTNLLLMSLPSED